MLIRKMGPQIYWNAEGGAGGGAGNPDGGAGNGAGSGNGSTDTKGANGSPFAGLSADNQQLATSKGWTDLDKAFGSYRELEGKIGKSLLLPDATADDAQWDEFHGKTGRPAKATDYKFERPKGVPADAPYDQEQAEAMKAWFHKAGLTPRQASMLHDVVFEGAHKVAADEAAADQQRVSSAHEALVKSWGQPESADYMRNLELANRVIRANGGNELLEEMKATGILTKGGEVKAPLFMQLMAKLGQQNYAEDALWSGAGEFSNPFAENSRNMAEQGKIINSDPDRARQLIRAAGEDPSLWGL